jgi:hypothetical protein
MATSPITQFLKKVERRSVFRGSGVVLTLWFSVATFAYGLALLKFSETPESVVKTGGRVARGAVKEMSTTGVGARKNYQFRVEGYPEVYTVAGALLRPNLNLESEIHVGDHVYIATTGGKPVALGLSVIRHNVPKELMDYREAERIFLEELRGAHTRGIIFVVLGLAFAALGFAGLRFLPRAIPGFAQWLSRPLR